MTERKPPGVSWESFVERQIREAQDRGEFEDLGGARQPIQGLDDHDELWWVRQKLRRENVSSLPPALAVRRQRDDALDLVGRATTESAVRNIVAEVNAKIIEVNRNPMLGPPTTVMPLDVERVVREWKERRLPPTI
jgi:hypothetical protein